MKATSYDGRGFTLIELLIVVAIIAILAAIAVPNFLEAQTRSKVTRTMADMRSVGVAFEAYATDYGSYPVFRYTGAAYADWLMVEDTPSNYYNNGWIGGLLTTPIAYMSSLPRDYYNTRIMAGRTRGLNYSFWTDILKPGIKLPGNFKAWFDMMHNQLGSLFPERPNWILESCGPDLTWWGAIQGATADSYLYDPTNGTISQGMIVHSDQGWISPRI